MAKMYFILFWGILTLHTNVLAQKVKIKKSTTQSWSGGIAGRYGIYYSFVVEFSGFTHLPIPDRIWVEDKPFQLYIDTTLEGQTGNTRLIKRNIFAQYEIKIGTTHDNNIERTIKMLPVDDTQVVSLVPPVKYNGVALLEYNYEGKEYFFKIERFTDTLEPINYP